MTGASGVAALAGCSGKGSRGSDGNEGQTSTDSNQAVRDVTYRNGYPKNPVDLNANPYNPQNFSQLAGRLLHDRYVAYSFATDEFQPVALEELTVEGKTVTMTLRDDLTWDNGTDVTTRDVETQLKLLKKTSGSIWGYIEGYTVVDEKTIELNLAKQTNPRIIKFELNGMRVDTPHEIFGKYLDKPATDLQTFQWEENILANAPWSHVSKDRQAWEFERNERFYGADRINFSIFLLESYGGNSALQQALVSGDSIDGVSSLFVPPHLVDKLADNVVENRMPSKWGYGVLFNHGDKDFGKRKVRQAVANVVNRQQVIENGGSRTKFAAPVPCGIAPKNQEGWLGDTMSDFNTYGVDESRTEEATRLLRDAGYVKEGGTWKDSEGNALGGEYLSPAGWTDWTTMAQTTVSHLNDFGFEFQITTVPTNGWFTRYSNSDFKMGVSIGSLAGHARRSPTSRYQLLDTHVGGGHKYQADTEYTIPAMGGSGEMTINPLQVANSISKTMDNEEATPLVREAAWHNHVDLPMLGIAGSRGQQWFRTSRRRTTPHGRSHALRCGRFTKGS